MFKITLGLNAFFLWLRCQELLVMQASPSSCCRTAFKCGPLPDFPFTFLGKAGKGDGFCGIPQRGLCAVYMGQGEKGNVIEKCVK